MRSERRWSVFTTGILSTIAACSMALCFFAGPLSAGAAEPGDVEAQTRVFRIYVDGTVRGKCTLHIHHRVDGTDWVQGEAGLLFNYYVYKYRFSSSGFGVWKDGRLVEMDRSTNFNGTKYHVTAATTEQGLAVTVNGKASMTSPDAFSTSYWQLPQRLTLAGPAEGVVRTAHRESSETVSLLDSDKGQKLLGEMQRLGDQDVMVDGHWIRGSHYRIKGDVSVELWYDANQRLLRRESVESGHKVLLELESISAE